MEFRDLALETIYLITGFLELDSDISALSRTSRQLHLSLDPYLYTNNVKRNHGCALVWAARLGRLSVARKLLEAGVPLVHEQAQPICLATIYGHDAIVKLFLERGLRPNKKELWWLQKWDCCDKIAEYYDSYTKGYYFDPIFAEEENKDPIDNAIDCGHDSLLQLLHAYDGMALWDQAKVADAIRRSIWHSYLAVVRFSEEKYPGTMKYLVQHDKSLLCTARNTEIAQALMEARAPVNITSADGNTPLSNAVRFNKADLVCFLVEAGACSNPVRPDGVILNLLRWAALEQNLEIVQHLMTHVDVESTIRAGGEDLAELLLVAVACGFEDLSERILMTKCIPGKTRDDCQILFSESDLLLKLAAKSGNINIVTLLLEKGADLNNEPRLGQTPLTVACESGNTDLVVLLLKHGIDVNHRDHEGKPALVLSMPFESIFDMLLSQGPDCEVGFGDRCNPIEWAIQSGNIAVVQRLLHHSVPLEISRDGRKMKTLLTAAGKGGAAMLHFLHSYGVKACPGEFEAQTAMRSAVVRGDSVTTEYLLNQGFDPNPTADELMVLPCGGRFECDEDSPLESYLVDAAQAASSEAAAATLDILLRYGADIGRLEKPPWCWSSSAPTLFYYPERQLVCLHLLLERGASPLPETKFGASMLTEVAEKYRREAIHLLLSHVEKRDLSLDDLYRNLLLVKKLSKKWMEENIQGSWYIVKLWRRLYWRKRYPVPT